ncbi:MAG TPA: hypothetical protein VGH87_11575 [Polyangiaceae bacterium]
MGDDWHNATSIRRGFRRKVAWRMVRFPLQPTAEETAFGFGIAVVPSGEQALMMPLPSGLRAVKVIADDGAVEYIVCDEALEPLYTPAKSLDELRRRFVDA